MEFKEFIHKFISMYFIILVGVFAATIVYCKIFYPEAAFNADELSGFFVQAFVADLPLIVFCSRKTLSERQELIRQILHFVLVEIAMVYIGWVNQFFAGTKELIVFMFVVVLVYVFVRLVNYLVDKKAADELNLKFKEKRKKSE